MLKAASAADIDFARWVRPGDRLAWGQCAAEPVVLTRALMAQRHRIGGRFSVFLGATWSDTVQPEHGDVIDFQSYCGSGSNRALAAAGELDVLPCHYSTFEQVLGAGGANAVDVLLLQVAPADDGAFSLSVAHEYLVPLIDSARVVIAEVNAAAPATHGFTVPRERIDAAVFTERALPALPATAPGPVEQAIARHAAAFIDDGATLQLGIGTIPDAVLGTLLDRRELGVHSGAIGDAVVELMQRGVITNTRKGLDAGATVAGVLMGGPRLNAFAHRNPQVQLRSTSYTHGLATLSRLHRFVAINSAIEVDLSGQINAEVAGGRYLGAVGGALDFMRGAAASGGVSLVALPSRAGRQARIVASLGGPVSTPRSDAAVIVTEHGAADLRGATLSQRVQRLLAIAHPDDREALAAAAHGLKTRSQS